MTQASAPKLSQSDAPAGRSALLAGWCIVFLLPVAGAAVPLGALDARNVHYALAALALVLLSRDRTRAALDLTRFRVPLYGLALAGYLAATVSKLFGVNVCAVDFSIFDQVLRASAEGDWMLSPIHGHSNLLIHQSWLLYPLVPLKAILPHPAVLQVVHALALWAAAPLVERLARRLGAGEVEALWLALAYLTAPTVAATLLGDFRVEGFYPLALLAFLYAWEARSTAALVGATALALAVKEDAPLYLGAFAVYQLVAGGAPWCRRAGAAVAAAAVSTFILDAAVRQHLIETTGTTPVFVRFWSRYGDSLGAVARGILSSPLAALEDVARSGLWRFYGAFAFLPLLSAPALAGSLPGIAMLGTASSYAAMHGYAHYYPIALVAFAFYGLARTLPRLTGRWPRFALAAVVISPLVGPGWLRGTPLDLAAVRDVHAAAEFIAASQPDRTHCIQTYAYPLLTDPPRGFRILDADCLARADGFVLLLRGKGAFPLDPARTDALAAAHADRAAFAAGAALVVPAALLTNEKH